MYCRCRITRRVMYCIYLLYLLDTKGYRVPTLRWRGAIQMISMDPEADIHIYVPMQLVGWLVMSHNSRGGSSSSSSHGRQRFQAHAAALGTLTKCIIRHTVCKILVYIYTSMYKYTRVLPTVLEYCTSTVHKYVDLTSRCSLYVL